jgi:hypothetical protein
MLYTSTITFEEFKKLPITPSAMIWVKISQADINKQFALESLKKLRGSGNGKLLDILIDERKLERSR